MFYTSSAVESLFEAVDHGPPTRDNRLAFARDLHYAERFDDALRCLAAILSEHHDDLEARILQADIYKHQALYEQAERAAYAVVSLNPACADGRGVLVDVYRTQGRWRQLEVAATHVIDLHKADGKTSVSALLERICARIDCGNFAAALTDLEEVKNVNGRLSAVASLQALLLLQTEKYEETLRIAQDHIRKQRRSLPWCGVLVAVRHEAAHRLGRPQEAGTVSIRAAGLLRRHGHGEWLDRLIADYGLHIWSKYGI
jgi:tetratricopeptide (TPR) repeat protein